MAKNFTSAENVTGHQPEDLSTIPTRLKRQMQIHNTTISQQQNFQYNGSYNMNNNSLNCTNLSVGGTDVGIFSCSDWQDAQHALFQLANFCLIISFLTPSSFKHHAFFLRLVISFGYLFFGLWAGVFVCMPDVLAWNVGFLLVNFAHVMYLGYQMCPTRLGHFTKELYQKMFKPLNVDRKRFKALTHIGDTYLLTKGTYYATEGRTKCGNKLSILLKGRLKVMYQNMFLHSIEPNQFIDSPEYDMFGNCETEETYQVSIVASEDSFLLTMSVIKLKTYLDTDPFISNVFYNVVGKDVSNKLYQIQELLLNNPDYMQALPSRQSSMVNLRSALVKQNSSVALPVYKLNCFGVDLKGWNINHHSSAEETVTHYPVETFESEV
ncbi:BVES [Mytilus coruscus]|uniref:BVES n=1 Tax=Mytilus coruscus TaxID=42192 RepID=A0A6J8DMR0_MYTCO|nr:BVES [Mytilus coruscus]